MTADKAPLHKPKPNPPAYPKNPQYVEADVLVEQWTQGHDDENREIRGKANGKD